MIETAVLPWLEPQTIIEAAGPWALLVVGLIIFAETGLLAGFILPGDTLLIISGLLSNPAALPPGVESAFGTSVFVVAGVITIAAIIAGEVGYWIGHHFGPAVFERKESGLFSIENVKRTNHFFERFGALTVILARFVPVVRTMTPVAAGVGHMNWKKYTLYNIIGAVIWGFGLTLAGYLLGFIPPIAEFVQEYIDLILLAAVFAAILPTIYHYLQATVKARKAAREGHAVISDEEAQSLVLDTEVLDHDVILDHEASHNEKP